MDLYFLIPAIITEVFIVIAELAILGLPTKQEKAENKTHHVTVKPKITKRSV